MMLIYLNLSRCKLRHIGSTLLVNLHSLDLSFNYLSSVKYDNLKHFPSLISLSLAGNPFVSLFVTEDVPGVTVPTLLKLDLSFVEMKTMVPSVFRFFSKLQVLNLSHCNVHHVQGPGLQLSTSLQVLDVRCPLTSLPQSLLRGLGSLHRVFADNYKVCCPANLPVGFPVDQCVAPSDEISSCDALLRSDLYRVSLAVFAALAVSGNIICFVLRVLILKGKQKSGFSIFVTHLCVSDFMMGVYLVIIGTADRVYLNTYLWEDSDWRESVTCKVAGSLSVLSSEVSAFIICFVWIGSW